MSFADSLINYVGKGFLRKATHLDFSGILGLSGDDVARLINELSNTSVCSNLLSVHLSDLGINDDRRLLDDVTDLFNISTSHDTSNDHHGGLYLALQMYLNKVRGKDY